MIQGLHNNIWHKYICHLSQGKCVMFDVKFDNAMHDGCIMNLRELYTKVKLDLVSMKLKHQVKFLPVNIRTCTWTSRMHPTA